MNSLRALKIQMFHWSENQVQMEEVETWIILIALVIVNIVTFS